MSNSHSTFCHASLEGKVAIITGSTQGLGAATARLFHQRGIRGLILTGRNVERGTRLANELTTTSTTATTTSTTTTTAGTGTTTTTTSTTTTTTTTTTTSTTPTETESETNDDHHQNSNGGCTAHFVPADLANLEDCARILQAADDHFGTLHILVNAAGWTARGSIWDTTPELYDRMMNVNVRAPFFLMQGAVRLMERDENENENAIDGGVVGATISGAGGSIVNISSTASYGSMPMLAPYAISKGALNVATKQFAYAVMRSRIRVNALAIGWMDTPGEDLVQRQYHHHHQSDEDEDDGDDHETDDNDNDNAVDHNGNDDDNDSPADPPSKDWKTEAAAEQPFGRLLDPAEVARCIAYCASDESGMMTGCVIDFDQSVIGGGAAPVPPPKEEFTQAKGVRYTF